MSRADEVAANLIAVRGRIDAAISAAGREPGSVELVVVTKYFPPSDVRILADLGVRRVGENRHQEALEKSRECADLELDWHFIGSIQSNKATAIAGYASTIESVDRLKLVSPLSRGAQEAGREITCLIQVSLDPPEAAGRGGASGDEIADIAAAIVGSDGLRLGGLMAVAPLGEPPAPAFERLAGIAERLRVDHPDAITISAGMSGDLEQAVKHGATHVRIGSSVLGSRPLVQ